MRLLETLSDAKLAQTFQSYLGSIGIESKLRSEERGTGIWILEESAISDARRELDRFLEEPQASVYIEAAKKKPANPPTDPHKTQKPRVRERRPADRWRAPEAADVPVTLGLIMVCIAVHFVNDNNPEAFIGSISPRFQSPHEYWRLGSSALLHGDWLHLLLNMLLLFVLGIPIEFRFGSLRYLVLVTFFAFASGTPQYYLAGASVGMSGAVYGLIGMSFILTQYAPRYGIFISRHLFNMALIWLFICFFLPNIANIAHVAGILSGFGVGGLLASWDKPKPQ